MEEDLGECRPVRESRLWLSGILMLRSSETSDESEEERDRLEIFGLLFEERRGRFFKSVGISRGFLGARKKLDIRVVAA